MYTLAGALHLLREAFALSLEDSQMDFWFLDKNRYLKK